MVHRTPKCTRLRVTLHSIPFADGQTFCSPSFAQGPRPAPQLDFVSCFHLVLHFPGTAFLELIASLRATRPQLAPLLKRFSISSSFLALADFLSYKFICYGFGKMFLDWDIVAGGHLGLVSPHLFILSLSESVHSVLFNKLTELPTLCQKLWWNLLSLPSLPSAHSHAHICVYTQREPRSQSLNIKSQKVRTKEDRREPSF